MLLKACGQDAADGQDQQDGNGGADGGQRDVPDALHAAGAVDGGGFVQLLVNARNRGKIDNGVVANALPGVGDGDDPPEIRPVLEEQDPLTGQAQADQQIVDQAVAGKEGQEDVRGDNPGNEVRQVGTGLNELLETQGLDLVQDQGEDDEAI